MGTGAASLTERLADWAAGLHGDDLPPDVAAAMAERILDTVGVRVAGARTPFARMLADAVGIQRITPTNCSETGAAFLNGAASSCLDFDDTHGRTLIHPTAPALFAALGAAATMRRTGRDVLKAVTLGVEIACRIAGAAPAAFHARGFHPTGVITPFGAAAAAALVLDPRPDTLRNALGLVASFGAGIMQSFIDGSDQRYLHSGNAAATGLLAARLASAGMAGSRDALEGRSGLFASHVPDAAPFDFDGVVSDLGARWECRSVLLKRYPTGFVTHPYIDAVLALGDTMFEKLLCVVPPAAVRLVCEPRAEKLAPVSATVARVSLFHMLAEALVYGAIDADSFSEDRLADPRVRSLSARIDYAVVGDEHGPARLVVSAKDGRSREISVQMTSMSRAETVTKFVANVGPQVGHDDAGRAAQLILHLDRSDDALDLLLPLLALPQTR